MSKTNQLTQASILTAIGSLLFILANSLGIMPYLAILFAGLCVYIIAKEISIKYALTSMMAIAVIVFMSVPNISRLITWSLRFGLYPAIKPLFDQIENKNVRLLSKAIFLVVTSILMMFVSIQLFGLNMSFALPLFNLQGHQLLIGYLLIDSLVLGFVNDYWYGLMYQSTYKKRRGLKLGV